MPQLLLHIIMKYSEKVKIYGQDVDMNGILRPASLLAMLEDAGSHHMEAYPPSNDDLLKRGMAFIASRIVMQIDLNVPDGAEAEAVTWGSDGRGVTHNRCYQLNWNGKAAAKVFSSWALVRLADHSLVRFGEIQHAFETEPPLEMNLPLRVRMPRSEEFEQVGERPVYFSDADGNGHMNNTKYISMLCDFVPGIEKRALRGINISYMAEAPYGDTLSVFCKEDGGLIYFKTLRRDGKINCEAVLYF